MVRQSHPSQSCAAAPGDCGPGEGEARGGSSGRCCSRVSSPQDGGDGAVGSSLAGGGRRACSRALERRTGSSTAVLRGHQVLGWMLQRFLGRGGSQEELTHFSLGVRRILVGICGGGKQH